MQRTKCLHIQGHDLSSTALAAHQLSHTVGIAGSPMPQRAHRAVQLVALRARRAVLLSRSTPYRATTGTVDLSKTCRKPGWTGWTGGWSMDTWRDVDQDMAVRTMHGRLNQRTATQRESRGRVQNIVEHGDLRESHAMQSASVPRTRTTLLRPSVPQAIIERQHDTSTQPDADTGY